MGELIWDLGRANRRIELQQMILAEALDDRRAILDKLQGTLAILESDEGAGQVGLFADEGQHQRFLEWVQDNFAAQFLGAQYDRTHLHMPAPLPSVDPLRARAYASGEASSSKVAGDSSSFPMDESRSPEPTPVLEGSPIVPEASILVEVPIVENLPESISAPEITADNLPEDVPPPVVDTQEAEPAPNEQEPLKSLDSQSEVDVGVSLPEPSSEDAPTTPMDVQDAPVEDSKGATPPSSSMDTSTSPPGEPTDKEGSSEKQMQVDSDREATPRASEAPNANELVFTPLATFTILADPPSSGSLGSRYASDGADELDSD